MEDPLRLLPRVLTKLNSIWVSSTYPFASIGRGLSIHYTCELKRVVAHRIKIGNAVWIGKGAWLNVAQAEASDEPAIVIEDRALIGPGVQITARNRIHIERSALISTSVLISDHIHAYEDTTLPICDQPITEGGRITIGEGVWIGRGAAIVCTRGELNLGRNCVVGANAVVLRSFPPYSVIFGNPAIVIRRYDSARKMWVPGSGRLADPDLFQ